MAVIIFVMATDVDIIFSPVVSSSSFFFFSPNLSGRRVDVYHTSTHGVTLVRIQDAGLKCAARHHIFHHIFVYSVVVTRNSSHRDKNYTKPKNGP